MENHEETGFESVMRLRRAKLEKKVKARATTEQGTQITHADLVRFDRMDRCYILNMGPEDRKLVATLRDMLLQEKVSANTKYTDAKKIFSEIYLTHPQFTENHFNAAVSQVSMLSPAIGVSKKTTVKMASEQEAAEEKPVKQKISNPRKFGGLSRMFYEYRSR